MNVGENTKEAICPIKISAGQTGNSKEFTPRVGHVIGVVIFVPDPIPNPGIVRASIKDVSGVPLSEMQDVRNYRSRDCKYLEGAKPLNFYSNGSPITVTYSALQAMSDDFEADLIFIYKDETQNCAPQTY